jgi:type III secretion protein J
VKKKNNFPRLFFFLLMVAIICTGCNKVVLYSDIVEKEAVQMQAILISQGIDCDMISKKDNLSELKVSKNALYQAIQILKGFGYPKDYYTDTASMFKKEGIVSSPLEERARYIYALSQDLAETISKIDGLITARVHIVLPENDPLSEYFQPSSASVFIKHRPTFNIQSHVHQIKQLVVNSIEGLSYEKVTIVPFSSSVTKRAPIQNTRIFGIEIVSGYLPRFQVLVYGLIFFLTSTLVSCSYLLWKTLNLQN